MNYKEIVAQVALETGLPKREAARVIQSFAKTFQSAMLSGEDFSVRNLGRFKRGMVAPGKRRTPTGKKIKNVLNVIYFKPAKALRTKMRRYL